MKLLFVVLLLVGVARAQDKHIILVCVDGLSSRGAARNAGFQEILSESNYTLRATVPRHTRSFEGWAAVLEGGYTKGIDRPGLFEHLGRHNPSLRLWVIGWYFKIFNGVNTHYAHLSEMADGAEPAVDVYLQRRQTLSQPNLLVIYMEDTDRAGHLHGWDSEEYDAALDTVVAQIKRLRAAEPSATFIITSDHGGHGHGHGYANRKLKGEMWDLDSPLFGDVPLVFWPGNPVGPICRVAVATTDVVIYLADAFGVDAHETYRRWGTADATTECDAEDVAVRFPLIPSAAPELTPFRYVLGLSVQTSVIGFFVYYACQHRT